MAQVQGAALTKQITREHWDLLFKNHLLEARKRYPSLDTRELHRRVRRAIVMSYGPRPPGEPKPPLAVRMGLWALKKKLRGLAPVEVKMSPLVKKFFVSVIYGVGALSGVVGPLLADGSITGNEWGALFSAFVAAFWGKFSSNTTVLAPSREGETVAGPGA